MIYQHFYSRVPAKKSMYRHTDGYDTFAKSEELQPEFIEEELSCICDYRPSKYENLLIWENKLPPVYSQFLSKSGNELVISCLSYIPRDYTNERSSFMVHSLIFDGEDKKNVLNRLGTKIINPSEFINDIKQFNLLSPAPISVDNVEEYKAERTKSLQILINKYNPQVLKRFIFALLSAACGKGKPIYVTLGKNAIEVSDNALELMNLILQIFPKNIRENISFITYLSDYTKLNNFKVKFLPPDCMAIPSGKGYIFDNMSTRVADGIRDDEYKANETMVEFFFGLITDVTTRNAFLKFCDRAIEKDESLREPKLKSIASLVFLFRQYSSNFTEKEVLPDDNKVYELFCVYEKYCDALTPLERSVVLECLNRYLRLHIPIPQNIFTKFCKLYPKEPAKSKRSAMKIILEMIHTDIMRDKLFVFIRNNYAGEESKSRSVICKDLCSVFYGGFLQPQILALFSQYFLEEEESVRNAIVEKLLLTIRTASIQDKVLEFFKNYQTALTPRQKHKFYETAYEMLVYGDSLSEKLVELLNLYLEEESAEEQEKANEKLMEAVLLNQRKKTPMLLSQVLSVEGFCKNSIIRTILLEHSTHKILDDFLEIICSGNIITFANNLQNIRKMVPYPSKQLDTKLFTKLCDILPNTLARSNLYEILEADDFINTQIVGTINEQTDAFCAKISNELLHTQVEGFLFDVFKNKMRADGLEFVFQYALQHDYIAHLENYKYLQAYSGIFDALKAGESVRVADCFGALPTNKNVCINISSSVVLRLHNYEELLSEKSNVVVAFATVLLLNGYLSKKTLQFDSVFDEMCNLLVAVWGKSEKYSGSRGKNLQFDATKQAYEALVFAGGAIIESTICDDVKKQLVEEESRQQFVEFLKSASTRLGKNRGRVCKAIVNSLKTTNAQYADVVKNAICKKRRFLFF